MSQEHYAVLSHLGGLVQLAVTFVPAGDGGPYAQWTLQSGRISEAVRAVVLPDGQIEVRGVTSDAWYPERPSQLSPPTITTHDVCAAAKAVVQCICGA